MSFDLYQAISDLRTDFTTLHDVDRAERIQLILQQGTSRRTLAKSLHISEKSIRNLAAISTAPAYLKKRALAGTISTRALIREMKRQQTTAKNQEELRRRQDSIATTSEISDKIVQWFRQEQIASAYGEQIVDRARQLIIEGDMEGSLPKTASTPKRPIDKLIEHFRRPIEKDENTVEYFAVWLALWVWFAVGDIASVLRSFELAWARLIRR